METIHIRFLGSGDAFGSGGRFQTCICIKTTTSMFLVDCGASSLIAMRRFGVAPNDIDMILLTHLHGDHFGGIPFFVLDAQLISKRHRPLLIVGPPGTQRRVAEAIHFTKVAPKAIEGARKALIYHGQQVHNGNHAEEALHQAMIAHYHLLLERWEGSCE